MGRNKKGCGAIRKLLVRPVPQPNQCRQDFLLTLIDENHLLNVQQLNKLLGVSYMALCTAPENVLLAAIEGELSLLEIPGPLHLRGIVLHTLGLGGRAKICPACIAEKRPTPPQFNLSLQIFCDKHFLLLHARCENCSAFISYRRLRRRECVCGADLAALPQELAPPWLEDFYEFFAPWRKDAELPTLKSARREFDIARLLYQVRHSNNENMLGNAYPYFDMADMQAFRSWLIDWPKSFEKALLELFKHRHPQRWVALFENSLHDTPILKSAIDMTAEKV
jgi:hypothetical protein